MKRFKCEVIRVDTYEIEIDETVINEAWMAEFRESFYPFMTLDQHAKHLAQHQARFGSRCWPEGYGIVKVDGKFPRSRDPNAPMEPAINIKIVDEDNDCEVECEEVAL